MAVGFRHLGLQARLDDIPTLQACASAGQAALTEVYAEAFRRHGIAVGQVLLSRRDLADRQTTQIVTVGQKCSFTIVVRNTGDYKLTKIFIIEKNYKGLKYDSFKGSKWTKIGNKFIYNKILNVGESANFTSKIGRASCRERV